MRTTIAVTGRAPSASKRSSSVASSVTIARPLTRSSSSTPGTRNSSPSAGVGDDVPERVDAPVAAPVGDRERAVVQHRQQPARRVAARRAVGAAGVGGALVTGGRGIGRTVRAGAGARDGHERRPLQPAPVGGGEPVGDLVERWPRRRVVEPVEGVGVERTVFGKRHGGTVAGGPGRQGPVTADARPGDGFLRMLGACAASPCAPSATRGPIQPCPNPNASW